MQLSIRFGVREAMVAVALIVVGLVVWWAAPATSQPDSPAPVATFAFVARADNPVDALAASSVAGQLGAPVYLTGTDSLDEQARQGLVETDPQVVVLAGGTAAVSAAVEQQIGALLPEAQVRRFAGAGRTETARLVNTLTTELGVVRPVVAGGTVTGDVGISGSLSLDGSDIETTLAAMTGRIDALETDLAGATDRIDTLETDLDSTRTDLDAAEGRIGTLDTDLEAAEGRIGTLEATLAGVSRTGDTLQFAGMNLQVVNGQDDTATSNSLGNLIIGYNAQRTTPATRTGSHYLVVGDQHEWTSYGGILNGLENTTTAPYASVTGGHRNTASGIYASVTGGGSNTASGDWASVSGGVENTANTFGASVSGGSGNTASGFYTTVAGGRDESVAGAYDTVIGAVQSGSTSNLFPDS